MSANALRWSVVPLGLLAFAGRLAVGSWLEPRFWHSGIGASLLAVAIGTLVVVVVPFGVFAVLCAQSRRRATFTVTRHGFLVPPAPALGGLQAMLWLMLAAGLPFIQRLPSTDTVHVVRWPAAIGTVAFFWAVALAILLVQRPQLLLTPDGLTVRRLRRTTSLAWDRLAPDGPPPPRKRDRYLFVPLDEPPVLVGFPPSETIPVGWLNVPPAFLADALRQYARDPGHRAAIGTPGELDRLRTAIAEERAASTVPA